MSFLITIIRHLKRPYQEYINYTLLIFILLSIPYLVRSFLYDTFSWSVYLFCLFYAISYLVVLVCPSKKVLTILLSIIAFFFPLNLFCAVKFRTILSPDLSVLISNTNLIEIKEFLITYLSLSALFYGIFLYIVLGIVIYRISVLSKSINISFFASALGLVLSLAALSHNPGIFQVIRSDAFWIFNPEEVIDLTQRRKTPLLEPISPRLPTKIIVIIGESFSKNHSSLYGYLLPTNPLLGELSLRGQLYTYSCVTSPAYKTVDAFRYILNTHLLSCEKHEKWYDSYTLMDILSSLKYETLWISNQQEKGLYDNLPSSYSKICDKAFFNQAVDERYDSFVLSFDSLLTDSESNQCIIYHLMGQHYAFENRYPKSFAKFSNDDYPDYQESQRSVIASYDNATLYNDYIVRSIIEQVAHLESIVIYFPDHGLDLFDTDVSYFGHGRVGDLSSIAIAKEIPFLVYCSDSLQHRYPEIPLLIHSQQNEPFTTDHFVHFLMGLLGFRISS